MNILKKAIEIWEEQRLLNIQFQKNVPEISGIFWPCWHGLTPDLQAEHINWLKYLYDNGFPDFHPSEKHNQAVLHKLLNGWQLDSERDNVLKLDPWLLSFDDCPDYYQDWGYKRDAVLKRLVGYAR